MRKRLLLTGGCGFIGHHTVEHFMEKTNWDIVVIDRLSYAGNQNFITDIDGYEDWKDRLYFIYHDFRSPFSDLTKNLIGPIDYLIHMGAESHVNRSIENPMPFAESNVIGTVNVLDLANDLDVEKMIYVSCYDEKTRALTKEGFKSFWEIKKGDYVLSINPETRQIEEKKVTNVIIQDYEGKMVRFGGKRVDMLVTPNHRMFNETLTENIKIEEAQYIKDKVMQKLPIGEWTGKDEDTVYVDGIGEVDTKDLFYITGIFIGDGFTAYQEKEHENKSGLSFDERMKIGRDAKTGQFVKTGKVGNKDISISKSWRNFIDIPTSDSCRKEVEKVLTSLEISWTAQSGKSGEHLYFTSKEWMNYFLTVGKYAENKHIPDWILEYDKKYLICLYAGLIDSDGHRKSTGEVYHTISDRLAENVIELGLKIGKYPRANKRHTEGTIEGREISGDAHVIHFGTTQPSLRKKHNSIESYKGKVWCLTVEDNKNFITERNGYLAYCGNTDEVYGPAIDGHLHKENEPHKPSNPYAASKAGAEDFCYAYWNTYNLPVIITRTMNNIGERQHPEKFLPKTVKRLLNGDPMIVHCKKENGKVVDISSRCWLHARNHADGILFLLKNGEFGEQYNISGEWANVGMMVRKVAEILDVEYEIEYEDFHSFRPGHDMHYGLDNTKIKEMGWEPPLDLEKSLEKTVLWMRDNPEWINW